MYAHAHAPGSCICNTYSIDLNLDWRPRGRTRCIPITHRASTVHSSLWYMQVPHRCRCMRAAHNRLPTELARRLLARDAHVSPLREPHYPGHAHHSDTAARIPCAALGFQGRRGMRTVGCARSVNQMCLAGRLPAFGDPRAPFATRGFVS